MTHRGQAQLPAAIAGSETTDESLVLSKQARQGALADRGVGEDLVHGQRVEIQRAAGDTGLLEQSGLLTSGNERHVSVKRHQQMTEENHIPQRSAVNGQDGWLAGAGQSIHPPPSITSPSYTTAACPGVIA